MPQQFLKQRAFQLGVAACSLSFLFCNVGKTENMSVRLFNTEIEAVVPHKTHFAWQMKMASWILMVVAGIAARTATFILTQKATERHVFLFLACKCVVCVICSSWVPWLAHAARINGPPDVSISTRTGAVPYVAIAGYTASSIVLIWAKPIILSYKSIKKDG